MASTYVEVVVSTVVVPVLVAIVKVSVVVGAYVVVVAGAIGNFEEQKDEAGAKPARSEAMIAYTPPGQVVATTMVGRKIM